MEILRFHPTDYSRFNRYSPLATNYTDLWWNANESGWGINFAHQGDIIFATWFTYDAGGEPWWLIAELHKSAVGVYSGGVSTVSGAPFMGVAFDSSKVVETPVGTATVTVANGNAATFSYTVNGTSRTGRRCAQLSGTRSGSAARDAGLGLGRRRHQ